LEIGSENVILRDEKRTINVKIHQRAGSWSLMSIIERNGELLAVFEDHRDENGSILYIGPKGIIARLSKSLESPFHEESCRLRRIREKILNSEEDVLGNEILSEEEDPSYEKVTSYLPPLRRLHHSGINSFVGSRNCLDKLVIFFYDPRERLRTPFSG